MAKANVAQPYSWAALKGEFDFNRGAIVFKGKHVQSDAGQYSEFGELLSDHTLFEGSIKTTVKFSDVSDAAMCEAAVFHDPATGFTLTAGLGAIGAYAVRFTDGRQWQSLVSKGEKRQIKANVEYELEVRRFAGELSLVVNGVEVIRTRLPWQLPRSQVGLWFWASADVVVRDFRVSEEKPKAFVVMQFTPPFDDLYRDVIKPVCEEFEVEARRADDTFGPGVILQDIVRQINESRFIIAEISAPNPNVFYEVGYAHALNKPTILIASKDTQLPFDVSGFRTLFYENSISGKNKIEEGLRKHVKEIVSAGKP